MNGTRPGVSLPARPRPAMPIVPVAPEHLYVPFTEDRPPTEGTNHFHWVISAFHSWGGEDGSRMNDSIVVEVEAPDEQSAWARAMEIVQRPYYRTNSVSESCALTQDMRKAKE